MGARGLKCFGSGQGKFLGSFEHGNERSGSKKFGKFLDYMRNSARQDGPCPMDLVYKLVN